MRVVGSVTLNAIRPRNLGNGYSRPFEELGKLALLRRGLALVGEPGIDHARHDRPRFLNALRARLEDIHEASLDVMALFISYLGPDPLACPGPRNEHHAPVAKAAKTIAAIYVLSNENA